MMQSLKLIELIWSGTLCHAGICLLWQVNQLVDLMSAEKSSLLQRIASLEVSTSFSFNIVC